ncbi:MAG: DUF3352 domain-containing protein [bacterium]
MTSNRSPKNIIIAIFMVVVILVVVYLAYWQFFRTKDVAELVKDTTTLYLSVDLTKARNNQDLTNLITNYGGVEILERNIGQLVLGSTFALSGIESNYDWLGDNLTIVKQPISADKDVFSIIMYMKDKEGAKNFLETSLKNISTEEFNNHTIYQSGNPLYVAYTYLQDYVVFSESIDGVRQIVDQSSSTKNSLAKTDFYKSTKKEINADTLATLLTDGKNFLSIVSLGLPLDLESLIPETGTVNASLQFGAMLSQNSNGLSLSAFLPASNPEGNGLPKLSKINLAEFAPANSKLYLEGSNIINILIPLFVGNEDPTQTIGNLQTILSLTKKVDLQADFIDNISDSFAIVATEKPNMDVSIPSNYFLTTVSNYWDVSLLVKSKDENKVMNALDAIINLIIESNNSAITESATTEGETTELVNEEIKYGDSTITHYEAGLLDLYVTPLQETIVLATNIEGIKNIIDVTTGKVESLSKVTDFKKNTDATFESASDLEIHTFYYVNVDNKQIKNVTGVTGPKKSKSFFKGLINTK